MRVFKVVRCPRCGFLQLTTASKTVKCFNCGHSWQLDPSSILFSSSSPEEARRFLLKAKGGKEGDAGFKKAGDRGPVKV
ncbi:MAG: hypothetical protein J7J94_04390 [Thaumarchaeota archaeon]|nr:hypothetical protein [Nitrososphaerota archaeon]